MNKNEIIAKIFYDPAGYGSIDQTLKDAKKLEPSITYEDVKKWKEQNTERKINLRGNNSFIADKPYEEFQMDLFFFSDLKDKDYDGALLMVDIFSKYVSAVPVKSKQIPEVLIAVKNCIHKMGGKPASIYSDNEGAFVSNIVQSFFKEEKIRHIVTLGHAPVGERTIRTIKNMIYQRVEKTKKPWHEELFAAILTYNNQMVSSVTKMTPKEAMKPSNIIAVKLNLESHRRTSRKYPPVNVGNKVKIFKKKDKLDKQQKSVWSPQNYEVTDISESMGQKFYKLAGRDKLVMRHEILLIDN